MEPIRILYVIGGIMGRGGIESYTMNYYRNIDKTKVQIDFVVHGYGKGVYDDEIIANGGKIYHVPVKTKDYFGNIKGLKKIFLSGDYKIVHSEMDAMNYVVLKLAKECGVPIRISHSHSTQHLTQNKLKFIINEYARKRINKYANYLFACSELAGRWLYGDKKVENGEVKIINNAINLDKFEYSIKKREEIRRELGIENEFIIGHVGRLHFEKNQDFLLQVFQKVNELEKNTKLIIVGDRTIRISNKRKNKRT